MPHKTWEELVSRIETNDTNSIETLYRLIGRGTLTLLAREFGEDAHDAHHEVFLCVLTAIQGGRLLKPRALFSFIRTLVWRKRLELIKVKIRERSAVEVPLTVPCSRTQADALLHEKQRLDLVHRGLSKLGPRGREVISRFYFQYQAKEQIISEMELTETQYRLAKNRAIRKIEQYVGRVVAIKTDSQSRRTRRPPTTRRVASC